MLVRLFLLALFAPLLACASAPEKERAPEPSPQALYAYRVAVAAVPAGAARLELCLQLLDGDGAARPLSARGLVGNAAFEHSLAEPFVSQGGVAELTWSASRELLVGTRARPLELELCLARAPATADELQALAQELARGTSVEVDGQPLAVTTTLVRLR